MDYSCPNEGLCAYMCVHVCGSTGLVIHQHDSPAVRAPLDTVGAVTWRDSDHQLTSHALGTGPLDLVGLGFHCNHLEPYI